MLTNEAPDYLNAWCIPLRTAIPAVTIVDFADYMKLKDYTWFVRRYRNATPYAYRQVSEGGKRRTIFMHREIMGFPAGLMIDHINRNGLDNRRCNLRVCTGTQNQGNRSPSSAARPKGVSFQKRYGTWRAYITIRGKFTHLGTFATAEEASRAYDAAAAAAFGEFALLNKTCGHSPTGYEVNDPDPFADDADYGTLATA